VGKTDDDVFAGKVAGEGFIPPPCDKKKASSDETQQVFQSGVPPLVFYWNLK
jgi:hypothetical protein